MEFTRRSSAASAADFADDGPRRFPEPPSQHPHGDTTEVIRDALLSQLQKDRLRQEIIMAELAKIERAMALRSAASDSERTGPAPFDFGEQFASTHGAGAVGSERHVDAGGGGGSDLKKEDGVRRRRRKGKRSKERRGRVTEDGLVSEESWKTSSVTTCEEAGGQKKSTRGDEGKPQQSGQAKKAPSTKWNCAICHVEATSADVLLQHFSGQKHKTNVQALTAKAAAEKSRKAEAEKSRKATQCEEVQHPPWTCRFCQAKCPGQSGLESHLEGKKHRAKIQALLEECESIARDSASSREEGDSRTSVTSSQDEERPASSVSVCGICQAKLYCQSAKESHVGGKKHRKNFQALHQEAKRLGMVQAARKQQAPPEWDCTTCQVRCNSESQFQEHYRSTVHMQMVQKALYFCKLCNVQCNSSKMLAHHQASKKHQAKLRSC